MRIAAAAWHPFAQTLRAPWLSARSGLTERRGWHVVLHSAGGLTGVGECSPLPAAGTEEVSVAAAWLDAHVPALAGQAATAAEALLEGAPPAAAFAVESALLDLVAQAQGVPLWRLLSGGPAPAAMACNAAVGPLDARLERRLAAAAAAGFRVAKVKVGLAPADEEAARLRSACRHLPAGMALRLDANGAWDEAGARAFILGLGALPVEMLEEPLARPEAAALARLQGQAPFPLALDEGLHRLGMEAVVTRRPVARAVLKPAVCGGLRRATALARRLRASGLECVVTTTLEGPVGTWAALHLAFAAGSPGLAHGLATGEWFGPEAGPFPAVAAGTLCRPEGPGLGCAAPRAWTHGDTTCRPRG